MVIFEKHLEIAKDILKVAVQNKERIGYNVIKTTRAGYTTNAIIAAMLDDKKILVVEPTNKIAIETVVKASGHYFNKIGANQNKIIRHLSSNSIGCSIIKERISKYPHLKEMPFLRSNDCIECQIKPFEPLFQQFLKKSSHTSCQIKTMIKEARLVEENGKKYCPDVCTITYDKLITLYDNDSDKATFLLDLISRFDVILFDEFGSYLTREEPSIEIFNKRTINKTMTTEASVETMNFEDKLQNVGEFVHTLNDKEFVKDFDKFDDNYIKPFILHTINEIISYSKYPYPFLNYLAGRETQITITTNDGREVLKPVKMSEAVEVKLSDWYSTLETIVENGKKNDVAIIKFLIGLMQIMSSKTLLAFKSDNHDAETDATIESIKIVNKDGYLIQKIQAFIQSHQSCLFSDATMPSFDFDKKIDLKRIEPILFGDPAKTNAQMLLAHNTKIPKYSNIKWYKNIKYKIDIIDEIVHLERIYGCNNIIIWIPSIKIYNDIYSELEARNINVTKNEESDGAFLTYYLSTSTRGIESKRRIGIAIGIAHKPVNAFKHLAFIYRDHYNFLTPRDWRRLAKNAKLSLDDFRKQIEDLYFREIPGQIFGHIPVIIESAKELFQMTSDVIQKERTNADTWQSISRSKCPKGEERSVVFCIGWDPKGIVDIKKQGGMIKHTTHNLIRTSTAQDTIISPPISISYNDDLSQVNSWIDGNNVDEEYIGFLADLSSGIFEMCFHQPAQKITLADVWLNIDKNLQIGYGTPDQRNGYLIGTIRTLLACNMFAFVSVTEPLPGKFEFEYDFTKTPHPPSKKFENLNAELIIRILRLAYRHQGERVSYSEIRNKINEKTASDKEIIRALRAIEKFRLLSFSSWKIDKNGKSKYPTIIKE